ncbi:MAG: isocitrate/isopropylmalate family dehydrogenase, partial [Pyrinomonadaceae bacterium]
MKITILPGDGIGPEVCRQAALVLNEVAAAFEIPIDSEEHLIGGAAIKVTGSSFPQETEDACVSSDAVLLGAVGLPEFDDRLPEDRPEIGLLKLRKALGGFANLRPAAAIPALIGSSPLRREIFEGTDMLIVRELLGGLYFGSPRGFNVDSTEAFNTMRYSVEEVERVAHIAFKSARSRRRKLTS